MGSIIKWLILAGILVAVAAGAYILVNKALVMYVKKEKAEFARDAITDVVGKAIGGMKG